jgi:hypothetical protein
MQTLACAGGYIDEASAFALVAESCLFNEDLDVSASQTTKLPRGEA